MASQASGLPPGFVLDPPAPMPPAPVTRMGQPRLPPPQTGTQAALDEERLRAAQIQRELDGYRAREAARTEADPAGSAGVDQRKNAGFYQRAARAAGLYEEHAVQPRGLVGQTIANAFPGAANVNADADRQRAETAARDFIRATLRYESGAAIAPSEFAEQYATYFPQPGDAPETIAMKATLRQNAIDALRISAGQAADAVDPNPEGHGGAIVPILHDVAANAANAQALASGRPAVAPTLGTSVPPPNPQVQPGEQLTRGGGLPPPNLTDALNRAGGNEIDTEGGNPSVSRDNQARAIQIARELTARVRAGLTRAQVDDWLRSQGLNPLSSDAAQAVDNYRRRGASRDFPHFVPDYESFVPQMTEEQRADQQLAYRALGGRSAARFAASRPGAFVINAADSASLSAPSLFSENYRDNLADIRARHPGESIAGSLVGGIAAPGGPRPGMSIGVQSLRSGAQGAVYGFNSSGGDPASALAGFGIGAAVPPAFRVVQSAGRGARSAFGAGANYADTEAQALARSLTEEGIPGSRPLLDPSTRTRAAYLESQRGSGGPIREGLGATREGVEAGVERIGAGGTAEPLGIMGTRVQDALRRDHREQGVAAGNLYDAADAMAAQEGAPGIRAIETVAQLDNTLVRLRRNAPANQPVIDYLETVRANFVDADGNLLTKSIADMRDIRTSVSGAINHRNLHRTRAEHYVTEALDAAKTDVARDFGTTAPEALRLYNQADAVWTARHTNRRQILNLLLGRDMENPISGEQTMARLQIMAGNRGDVARLDRMWGRLRSDEQLDVAATLAESATARSADEGFQLGNFINWARSFSPEGRRAIFGPQASRSISNLVRISKALQATEGALNKSRSGVVRNWRSAFRDLVVGGPVGGTLGALGGGSIVASTGAGIALGATTSLGGMAVRRLSARSLMSPDMSRWLLAAAQARTPGAIQTQIGRLQVVARAQRNPAVAQEILGLRQALLNAVNDNVPQAGRLAASPEDRPDDANQ